MGSNDVIHTKWSNCPTGDLNRAKGKESYPFIAFQVISDYDRQIQAILSAQCGICNDKHTVKIDKNVAKIRYDWYTHTCWAYFTGYCIIKTEVYVYLICDNRYCYWPISTCPFKCATCDSIEGHFSCVSTTFGLVDITYTYSRNRKLKGNEMHHDLGMLVLQNLGLLVLHKMVSQSSFHNICVLIMNLRLSFYRSSFIRMGLGKSSRRSTTLL